MLQLADQVAQIIERSAAANGAAPMLTSPRLQSPGGRGPVPAGLPPDDTWPHVQHTTTPEGN